MLRAIDPIQSPPPLSPSLAGPPILDMGLGFAYIVSAKLGYLVYRIVSRITTAYKFMMEIIIVRPATLLHSCKPRV